MPNGVIVRGESTRGDGAKCMANGVKPSHACPTEAQETYDGKAYVGHKNGFGDLLDAG